MQEVLSIPNASKTFKALRSLGYDINSSIADIVDNALTSRVKADKINIIFKIIDSQIVVRIQDNGCGMNSNQLEEAMRIGAEATYETGDLGKFGLGMKTASLSHCNILTVISKTKSSEISGYRWNLGHVKNTGTWSLLKLDENAIEIILKKEGTKFEDQGTLVLWDDLLMINKEYNSVSNQKLADNYLYRKTESLKLHLSMVFHRFLEKNNDIKRNLSIQVNNGSLYPWDPFCKMEPECERIPLRPDQANVYVKNRSNPIEIKAYILPSKEGFSSEKAWKEAKGLLSWNDSQGYYVYRANRLIRFGGWHGTKAKDEHDKLARLSIDIDPELDDEFRITVNKNRVEFPEQLFQHLKNVVNPLVVRKAKIKYKREPEKNLVVNKVREGRRIQNLSVSLLNDNKIRTNSVVSTPGIVEVQNPMGSWLSNKLNEFLKYGNEDDYEIVSDHIENGQLWKIVCDPNNKFKVIINSSHPFYSIMYRKGVNPQVTEAIDVLLFSLAFGELYNKNSLNSQLFETFKTVVSRALDRLIQEKII